MSENAELWTYPDEKSARIGLINFLKENEIKFDEDMETEELRKLYIDFECGRKLGDNKI